MPEGPDGKTIIIVKKVSGHGGHHGGAWKVAYADFVTAMMALFMVLWLVNSAAEPTRQRIASYFRKPGIFQKGSGTPIEIGGGGILPDAFSPTTDGNSQIQASDKIYHVDAVTGKVKELYDPGNGSKEFRYAPALDGGADRGTSGETNLQLQKLAAESEIEQKKLEDLKTEIQKIIEEKAGGDGKEDGKQSAIESILGEIEIKLDKRGLVIEIMDTEKSSMFQVGQAGVQAEAETKLLEIGKLISKVSNPIDIEGHTDARPYKSKDGSYDNWNLSSDRANAARRVLEKSGFKKGQIARVVGYADERPRDQENPLNPANRRITISMRYSNKAKEALDGTNLFETASGQKVKNNPKGTAPALKPTTLKSLEEKKPKESDSFVTAAPTVVTKEEKVATPEAVVVPEVESTKEQEQGLKMEISTVTEEAGSPEEYQTPPLDEEKKELIFGKDAKFFKK